MYIYIYTHEEIIWMYFRYNDSLNRGCEPARVADSRAERDEAHENDAHVHGHVRHQPRPFDDPDVCDLRAKHATFDVSKGGWKDATRSAGAVYDTSVRYLQKKATSRVSKRG